MLVFLISSIHFCSFIYHLYTIYSQMDISDPNFRPGWSIPCDSSTFIFCRHVTSKLKIWQLKKNNQPSLLTCFHGGFTKPELESGREFLPLSYSDIQSLSLNLVEIIYFIFPESFQFFWLVLIFIKIPIIISCLQNVNSLQPLSPLSCFLDYFSIYCQDDLAKAWTPPTETPSICIVISCLHCWVNHHDWLPFS